MAPGFLACGVIAKQVSVYPRQDVYVEHQRPTWSYRTAILQVGKAQDGGASEYRAFLGFDLSPLASSGARIVSAKLVLHPLLASANARLTHHACLLSDVTWRADEVTWESQPDAHCVDQSAPCCGGAVGSWQPRPSQPAEVDLTYYVKAALGPSGDKMMAMHLYAPTAASSAKDHFYVQYGSSRRGDASTRPSLRLEIIAPTSSHESVAEGRGLYNGVAGTPSTFVITARDAEGVAQGGGGDAFAVGLVSSTGAVINATISDLANGTYVAYYTPTVAGTYTLDASLHGAPVADSPYAVHVFPSHTAPAHCAADGAGLVEATAGAPASLLITPRDAFGNSRPLEPPDVFTVSLARVGSGTAGPGALVWQNTPVRDQLNGTYASEYLVKRAGAYYVQVMLGGIHIMGSPFQLPVLAAKTNARASSAHGSGLRSSVAGSPASFGIIARDEFGNERAVCGDDFQVTLSGPEKPESGAHVHGLVSENGNGTYTVEYAVTTAGLYYIAVTLQGRHISGSPFAMQTFPSAARSSHSLAFGSGLSRATAGKLTEFHILAKDTYGNAEHASAGGNFSVVLHGAETLKAKVTDSLTGVYVASYTPRKAGTYQVSVAYDQLPIFGSPYNVVVAPGRAHAATSVVKCVDAGAPAKECAALVGIAGEVNAFTVTARDTSHNDCTSGGEKVEALLMLPARTGGESPLMRTLRERTRGGGVKVTVLDLGDGSYAASYTLLPAGRYQLAITIDGQPINGSPFETLVTPGATCAGSSQLSGDGKDKAVAGQMATMLLTAVDCYGNMQTAGGDPWSVSLTRPGVTTVSARVLDKADGTYALSYNAAVSGLWQLHVMTGGAHADGSPFSVLIDPGPTDAHASIAVGEGTSMAAIGETTTIMVRSKDHHGNDRGVGGDYVSATLTQGTTNSVVHARVRDTRDGSYTLSYVLTISALPHDYLMAIRVNNASIGGSPFRVRARPGPTVCEETISIERPKCIAGAVSEAPIFAKDRLGNQRTSGGDIFSASLELLADGGANESVQVGDNADGTYRALWVVTRAAKHRLWISGTCGAIKGSPYEVDCTPAPLSVTHSQLHGPGASEGIAGAATKLDVLARDVFDNVLLDGHYRWGSSLSNSVTSWSVAQSHAGGGGHYPFTYNVTRAGSYELILGAIGTDGLLNASLQAQGSPSTIIIRPGPLCGRRSKVFGPTSPNGGLDGGAMDAEPPEAASIAQSGATHGGGGDDGTWYEGAGRPVRLWVEARDCFDNAHETAIDPAPFKILVLPRGSTRSVSPAATVRAASRGGSGAYTADFVLPQTGDYLVKVVAELKPGASGEGGELLGSPYPLKIVPGPTSAFQSTAAGPGLSSVDARVGALQFVAITARDMHGNPRSRGGDRFAMTLDGPNGTRLVASSMVDYSNGTFVGSYLATVAGNYLIHIQRADPSGVFWEISGSPFKLHIATGPTNPFVSRLVGPHEAIAGEQSGFTLMSRDEFGNAPLGGERNRFDVAIVPRLTGTPQPVARLYDAGKGNYTILHVFNQAGEYGMRTTLQGYGGGTLPDFPLRVLPGPLSPPHSEVLWPCHTPKCIDASTRRAGYFVGWPVRFSVLPFDAFGNRRADAGMSAFFVARVHGPRHAPAHTQLRCAGVTGLPDAGTAALHCRAEQHADGLYVVEFTPLVRGEFTINVTVHAGPYGARKLGNLPGSMVVHVDAAPVATCARWRNCTSHGHCDYLTGRCVCDAGFDGDDCSHGAAARRKCPNDCSGHGYCSDETDGWGRNLCRCAVDYTGADCSTWVTLRGNHDALLTSGPECPNECSGHGGCNATSGECACEPGYGGDDCSVSGEHSLTQLATDGAGRAIVLDFAPSTRRFAVHAIHSAVDSTGATSCAGADAQPLCSGTWPVSLDANHAAWSRPFLFASLGAGMLLQYEPAYGAYALLGCDGNCDGGVPCSRRLATGRCSELQLPLGPSMRASYLGSDTVLFHNGATGAYTLHRIARGFLEQSASGCMFDPPLASGVWPEVGVHRYSWLGVGDLLVDYEPARGNYTLWTLNRGAQAEEDPREHVAMVGHLMATSKAFVSLGDGLMMLASTSENTNPPTTVKALDSFGDGAYAMWVCSKDVGAYTGALPCRPVGHADGLGRPHSCPSGCAAGDCNCASKGLCVAQAGCGWCADAANGMCMVGGAEGPGAHECFAWTYSYERSVGSGAGGSAAAAYEAHSYTYLEHGQLVDYSASDGQYKLWNLARPPRPGCPGVEWPPAASGTLAVTKHSLAGVPSGDDDAFALLDYDPLNGDYRLGVCNRSVTSAAQHLDCHTASNGTWHTGGLQLLYVGDGTLMRYSKGTGQYSLWAYHPPTAGEPTAFESTPLAEGSLLRADGQRLKGATLTYLDAGELLATVPSSGFAALYRRATIPPASIPAESWAMVPESILGDAGFVAPVDGFAHRWESATVLRGWQFSYVGQHTLMMLKPSTGSYRMLNCSQVYTPAPPPPGGAARAEALPCTLLVEGTLPTAAYCEHSREHCLLAPHCGWCESLGQCVASNEDGVCFGGCPDGQLLYATSSWQPEGVGLVEGGPSVLLESAMLATQAR